MYLYYTYLMILKKYNVTNMFLFKFFLITFMCLATSFLNANQSKLQNIRISDSFQNKSSRIVLDLSHKSPYSLFILNNKPRLVIDIETIDFNKNFKIVTQFSEVHTSPNGALQDFVFCVFKRN